MLKMTQVQIQTTRHQILTTSPCRHHLQVLLSARFRHYPAARFNPNSYHLALSSSSVIFSATGLKGLKLPPFFGIIAEINPVGF
jgi:hypothetical protein